MITRIKIDNFQSLREVDVALGRFTVIVGPSNSGKSAFLRAVKAMASNIKGKAFITTGATQARISVRLDEDFDLVLARSTATSKDSYTITPVDSATSGLTYTKLGGAVPEEVTQTLKIAPVKGTSLHFAGQFDRPYLLDDTGGEVARTLGELTNVTVMFAAAREANRRKLGAGALLKAREADLAALVLRAESFAGLPARLAASAEAQAAAEAAVNTAGQRDLLANLLSTAEVSASASAQAEAALASLPTAVDVPVEDIAAAWAEQLVLAQLIQVAESAATQDAALEKTLADCEDQIVAADAALREYLLSLGHCPVCGASSEHMHVDKVLV